MKNMTGNIILGLFVIGVLFLIIIPLPEWILSFLLMLNISISIMLLLSALFSKEALDLSLFPSVLLITTMFRLSLNIASTRLILRDGDAGIVIESFGEFVSGGNLVIGSIIFIIISIVNFLVITKGSERVAEVGARFALDAMPGKQMAIDADLNSGFINEEQAKARRKKVQDEATFFGSMDGASKFVKNDAIASILISFINIIAGIIMGVTINGLAIGEAASKYTILTIGDGLVSSIPALLISAATGILVTKTAQEDSNMSELLFKQMAYNPTVLFIVGFVVLVLGIFTPMGLFLTLPISLVWFILGYMLDKKQKIETVELEISSDDIGVAEMRKPENVISLLEVDPISLEFGYSLIPLADETQGGDLVDRVIMIRRQLALELGAIVPTIRLRDSIQLQPNEYCIKIKGVTVAKGEILPDHFMAMNSGFAEGDLDGIKTIEPAFKLEALWISSAQRERAEAIGYTVVDGPSIIATHLTEVVKDHLDELLTRQTVQTLIDNLKEKNPALVSDLVPKLLSLGEIQKVLANLLKEKVSIRDFATICETLADYAPTIKDPEMLTEYVRISLGRSISSTLFTEGVNNVITVDPSIEQMIMDNVQRTEHGSYINIDAKTINKIVDSLKKEVGRMSATGQMPIVLTSPIVRTYFRNFMESYISDLIVVSYGEIDKNVEIRSIGMVRI